MNEWFIAAGCNCKESSDDHYYYICIIIKSAVEHTQITVIVCAIDGSAINDKFITSNDGTTCNFALL